MRGALSFLVHRFLVVGSLHCRKGAVARTPFQHYSVGSTGVAGQLTRATERRSIKQPELFVTMKCTRPMASRRFLSLSRARSPVIVERATTVTWPQSRWLLPIVRWCVTRSHVCLGEASREPSIVSVMVPLWILFLKSLTRRFAVVVATLAPAGHR